MKKFAVLIPEELDVDSLAKEHGLDANYLKYLIHYMSTKVAFYIEQSYKGKSDLKWLRHRYFNFNQNEMRLVRSDKYTKHISFLIGNNFEVEVGSRTKKIKKPTSILYRKGYVTGVKSYSYRFGGRFLKQRMKIGYIYDYKLINNIKKPLSKTQPVITSGKYKFLNKFFDPSKLTINLDSAINLCEERYKVHKNYIKYINELVQLTDLSNGVYRFYYNDKTDGRVHSNITRLPKVYRRYVSYEGSTLIEIDLSNSIVFFIALLINPDSKKFVSQNISNVLMIYKSLEGVDIKEVQLFSELAFGGKIYNYLIPYFEKRFNESELINYHKLDSDEPYIGDDKQKRKIVKKQLLAMLFAKVDAYSKIQEVFALTFPMLLEKINTFKKRNGYKVFSHLLFQTEAISMIDKCARQFNRENRRKAPVFTLHDCLITIEGYEGKLEETMKEEFVKLLGVSPNMGVERWE